MPVKNLRFGKGFSVAVSNRRAQGATMVIRPLKTFNVYVPPAYRADGGELPRGKS